MLKVQINKVCQSDIWLLYTEKVLTVLSGNNWLVIFGLKNS